MRAAATASAGVSTRGGVRTTLLVPVDDLAYVMRGCAPPLILKIVVFSSLICKTYSPLEI